MWGKLFRSRGASQQRDRQVHRSNLAVTLLALLLPGTVPLQAQLPTARLLTVFPPGGQAGSEFEVKVTGIDLDEASRLYFQNPEITSQLKPDELTNSTDARNFVVRIPTNAPAGIYEARVVSRYGVSNPRAFTIGVLPENLAPTTNDTPASATPLPLETTVSAHAAEGNAHYFNLVVQSGQRILVTCQATEIDSRMDPVMVLYSSAGKEVERSRSGGLLDFTATTTGTYLLKVHDGTFRGGNDYFYRLTASTRPQLDFIFPPSGVPGSKGKYQLFGRNLPGGKPTKEVSIDGKALEQLEVAIELPSQPTAETQPAGNRGVSEIMVDGFEYCLGSGRGKSNPVRIGLTAGPVVSAPAPDALSTAPQTLSLPCEWTGRFPRHGGFVSALFEAKKGEAWRVEVLSHRLGLPTSPLVILQRVTKNDKGEEQATDLKEIYGSESNVGGVEFNTAPLDPVGRFEVPENGTYRIKVRDLFNRAQTDARAVFRVSLRQDVPDFRLLAAALAPPPVNKDTKEALIWTPFLRRGETQPIRIITVRRDGFAQELEFTVEGLPAGVRASSARTDNSAATLLLTASEDVTNWVGPVKILARSMNGGKESIREARGCALQWSVPDYNNEAIHARLTGDFVLGVGGVESAPVSIQAAEDKTWEASAGAKLNIPLRIVRRGEFNGKLSLKAAGHSALESLKNLEVDEKATNATLELNLAEQKLPPGSHTFYLTTQATGKYRRNPEAAKAAEDALHLVEANVTELTSQVKTAGEAVEKAKLKVTETEKRAKLETEALASAAAVLKEAETLSMEAINQASAAAAALAAKPEDPSLLEAKTVADQAVEKARSKSLAALESKKKAAAAEQEANSSVPTAATALKTAQATEVGTKQKLKDTEAKKEVAQNSSKAAAKTAEPRDLNILVYSAPIQVKINPAPQAGEKTGTK